MDYLTKINGLHEIHISVKPEEIALLRWYCKDKKIKPILASSLYGDNPNQLMISKFKHGTSKEVLDKGELIVKDMKSYGLNPIRLKIEAMMNSPGAPVGDESLWETSHYWEFHIKVPVNNSHELDKLKYICDNHNSHISANVFKTELEPLVTLRLYYPTTYNQAMERKAKLIKDIKRGNFELNYGIHQELCIYDDNQELDKGWLI